MERPKHLIGMSPEQLERIADKLINRRPFNPTEPDVVSLEAHEQGVDQLTYNKWQRSGDPDLVGVERDVDRLDSLRPLKVMFQAMQGHLSPVERGAIQLRGVLDGEVQRTFAEIGKGTGIGDRAAAKAFYRAMDKISRGD